MKYFEDVQVGDVMRFGHYEVTREEIVEYARQFDPQPFHLDEEAAKASMFGGLIASGWHTGAMFIRMVVEHMTPVHATSGAMGFDGQLTRRSVRYKLGTEFKKALEAMTTGAARRRAWTTRRAPERRAVEMIDKSAQRPGPGVD